MTDIAWFVAAVVVGVAFLLVGFLIALVRRLSSVFRATILVGPIEWWPIAIMGLLVVLLPLLTLIVARPAIDPFGFASIIVAALLGGFAGAEIAEWEARAVPKVLEGIAEVSLRDLDPSLVARAAAVTEVTTRFVGSSPPFLRDILDSICLVFNSPWASWWVGLGFSSFLQKSPDGRRAYVQKWSLDPSLRYGLEFLKVVLSFGVYGDAEVWKAIAYCGPIVDRYRGPDGRARFSPYDLEDAESRGIHGADRFRCWDRGEAAGGGG